MNKARARLTTAGTITVLALTTLPALARSAPPTVQAWDVSRDPSYASGEPWVAVDPTNSRHVIVGWTATGSPNVCGRAVSWDRGRTWKRDSEASCTDALVAWGPHGVAYFGGILSNDVSNGSAVGVSRSTDGGRTWSAPVVAFGLQQGLGNATRGDLSTIDAFDRPWYSVDASTGTLYVSGLDHETTAGEPNSADRYFFGGGRRFVIASHDGGRTFGHSHPLDDVNNPDHSMGTISTTHGVLAAAYTTSATSTATDTACPCTVFETSRDDGANWDRHVIPQSSPAVADNSAQDVVQAYVAADPTHKGRFAVGVLENGGRNLVVHVTTDAGHTWTAHAVEQAAPTWIDNRPWIAYGADGALGVMWRRDYQNATCEQLERNAWFQQCPYDVYGAVSVRGDGRFRGPVRFTSARSQPSSTYAVGDDVSYATMSGGTLWATWGDWRTGDLDAWLGAYHYAG